MKTIRLIINSLITFAIILIPGMARVEANIYTVSHTDDAGAGSLREALLSANAHAGLDYIYFNMSVPAPYIIKPTIANPLPTITDPVVIDGYTQPGSSPATATIYAVLKIVIDGSDAGSSTNCLHITAGNSTVKGLVIHSFTENAIFLENGGNNLIQGN